MTGREVVDHAGLKKLGVRYCKVHLGRLEEDGEFPQSFKLGKHHNSPRVWYLCEIVAWIEAQATRPPKL